MSIILGLLIILCKALHVITISQKINWVLISVPYLTISFILWSGSFKTQVNIRDGSKILMTFIFGAGYLLATFGFFLIFIFSLELDTDQEKYLTDNLIYKERNIGQGPDPSARLKKISIYKKLTLLPILASRVTTKTHDTWNLPLQPMLDISVSKDKDLLYLKSVVEGHKVFNWADTIWLTEKHYR